MKSITTFIYHAFTSILFAGFIISCSSDMETNSSASENSQINKIERPNIPVEVKDILAKSTCLGCHKMNTKLIGPSYSEIALKGYSEETIIDLIKNPNPKNWPEYPPMAPITWLAEEELATIASWISTLKTIE
ncbi:hypothetical protein OAQ85_00185 [Schleiferiaceae bacterium]|nr:hypothetical protein [Schleiferiaceae bacterium]